MHLTPELLQSIARLPIAKRTSAMRQAALAEWRLCADDPFYWLDATQHIVPYAYTRDPKPVYTCNICNDGVDWESEKRYTHAASRHNLNCDTLASLRQHFTQLDTIRPFPLHDYMRPIIECWLRYPLVAVEKSRDMTMTWLCVALYTWDTIFHKGVQNIFQSEDATKTRDLVSRSWILYNNQPKWLRNIAPAMHGEGTNRAGLLRVPSLQSEIIGFPAGADKIRQYHPSGVFSDEAAFNPEASDTYAAIKPAISGGGRYTAISSPNLGWFQQICRDMTGEE